MGWCVLVVVVVVWCGRAMQASRLSSTQLQRHKWLTRAELHAPPVPIVVASLDRGTASAATPLLYQVRGAVNSPRIARFEQVPIFNLPLRIVARTHELCAHARTIASLPPPPPHHSIHLHAHCFPAQVEGVLSALPVLCNRSRQRVCTCFLLHRPSVCVRCATSCISGRWPSWLWSRSLLRSLGPSPSWVRAACCVAHIVALQAPTAPCKPPAMSSELYHHLVAGFVSSSHALLSPHM